MPKLRIFIFLSAIAMLFVSGCSVPPEKPEIPKHEYTQPKHEDIQAKQETTIKQLELNILQAQKNKNWSKFIQLSQTLWQKVDSKTQIAIEREIYTQLIQLEEQEQQKWLKIAETQKNIDLKDWLTLIKIRQKPTVWQRIPLEDLKTFNTTAIYHHNLLPELINNLNDKTTVQNIAVLLPFSGPYTKVSQQIRNGILKHQLHYPKDLTIRFYDSSDLNQLVATYQQALDEGAEKIIGPLKRESIALLAKHQAQNLIALNLVQNTPFTQLSFNSLSEASQITNKLNFFKNKNIAILSNDARKNTTLSQEVHTIWNQKSSEHHALSKTYSSKNPQLREALGGLINIPLSQKRYDNLRWLLREKLTFTPRPRQDLDAILILDLARNIAVFKPQMNFFGLDVPVFSSSGISPSDFISPRLYPDLRNVIFPTSTAVLYPQNTKTSFESFGWDSLTLAINPNSVIKDLCTKGQKGLLTRTDDNIIDTHFIWAIFDRTGKAVPLNFLTNPAFFSL